MVTAGPERRDRSEYSLARIHELAKVRNVHYGSQRVFRDITNLDYTLEDVCECLCHLKDEHYRETLNYHDKKGWLDVYAIHWCPSHFSSTAKDPLYIKLKLDRDCITIDLMSFHRDGAL